MSLQILSFGVWHNKLILATTNRQVLLLASVLVPAAGMSKECRHKAEKVYRPRRPERSPFYSVLFHYFERFAAEYEFRFEKHYGKWRSVIRTTVGKFIDCGVLKNGFARVR